ncbi:MAG: DUF2461 domain-containing protein [Leptospiraceae bacterium]|nr:DUF2461 domain-containing protein [Leptospiraceae bacterium]MCP5494219.1 DUF2461 domain-containing protein [Leptospiraceae bacterium]
MIQKTTLDFLRDLKENNTKDWFQRNKSTFEKASESFSLFTEYMIAEIEKFDKSVKGVRAKDCIFRIYKDVRFAKDKSPYKTNFGAYIKKGGKKNPGAGYYIHVENGDSFIGGGCYCPPSRELAKIREAIDKDPKPLKKIIEHPNFKNEFGELTGDKVKTAPKGFAKDHPEIGLLQFKSYLVLKNISNKVVVAQDFKDICANAFKLMYPLNEYLNKILM